MTPQYYDIFFVPEGVRLERFVINLICIQTIGASHCFKSFDTGSNCFKSAFLGL